MTNIEFLKLIEANTNNKGYGNFTLKFNDFKSDYDTAEKVIKEDNFDYYSLDSFESEEMMNKCIATNTIWTLHWYNNTPVGFLLFHAPTLEDLLRMVTKEIDDD